MSCESECYETRMRGADGRMMKVATKGGRFPAGTLHPVCAECENCEQERMKAMLAGLKPGETVTIRHNVATTASTPRATAASAAVAKPARAKTDEGLFAEFQSKFSV